MTYRTFDGTSQVEAITDGRFSSDSAISTSRVTVDKIIYSKGDELTIASGVITVWDDYHLVDTEGDASSDDLTTINGGQHGQVLILRAADSGRTVSVAEGGNINLASSPRALDNTSDTIMLLYDGSSWLELSFSNNAS